MNAVADIVANLSAIPARGSFVLPADQRGYGRYLSTGEASSYIAGHPESVLTRQSSFNFHEYQSGREGFGAIRVFGDETFSGVGCGYNMHPHHNFVICAFVLQGELTHVNTVGNIDQLHPGDYYVFSAGSGGKHAELNLRSEDMHVIYVWFTPDELYRPPSYHRAHFDAHAGRNRLVTLIGDAGEPALPIPQDVRISRLTTDLPTSITYRPASTRHGVYAFVIEGGCEWNGARLNRRDSAGIWGVDAVDCTTAPGRSDVLFVETIM
jgi:redox-sensitive bicupin YhaK (pirin superfamily)